MNHSELDKSYGLAVWHDEDYLELIWKLRKRASWTPKEIPGIDYVPYENVLPNEARFEAEYAALPSGQRVQFLIVSASSAKAAFFWAVVIRELSDTEVTAGSCGGTAAAACTRALARGNSTVSVSPSGIFGKEAASDGAGETTAAAREGAAAEINSSSSWAARKFFKSEASRRSESFAIITVSSVLWLCVPLLCGLLLGLSVQLPSFLC